MLQKVKHSKTLPTYITANQMVTVCQEMHDHILEVVTPLVESNPHYQAIAVTLPRLQEATSQLKAAVDQRKFKSARKMQGVGGADGLSGDSQLTDEKTISVQKRQSYDRRQLMMRRLKFVQNWKLQDAIFEDQAELKAAANLIGKAIDRRINHFERLSYEESATQFDLFFESIDGDAETQAALPVLGLTKIYGDMKSAHEAIKRIHREQTQIDAIREELPKLGPAADELRQVARFLLSMLHFDVASGVDVFNPVLGHVDEMIDKVRAVGKRRKTLDKKTQANSQTSDQASGESDAAGTQSAETGDAAQGGNATDDKANQSAQTAQAAQTSQASGVAEAAEASEPVTGGDTDPPVISG